MKKTVALVIMDGYGITENRVGNAIATAETPNIDRLHSEYPTTLINASGRRVGLPEGQMGNSEVGHLNIGAGRVVYQDITRIDKSIEDGEFFKNDAFKCAMENLKDGNALHLVGLLSDGGVHSNINHLFALMEMAKRKGVKNVYIHAITDGRDVPPDSGARFLSMVESQIKKIGIGAIATIVGRYYYMDRDKRWDRVEKGYNAVFNGYIYPVLDDALSVACFICVSGYKGPNYGEYIKKCSAKFNIPTDELFNTAVHLKSKIPEKSYVDTLIFPLVRMLELAYISIPKERDGSTQISAIKNYINRSYSQNLNIGQISRQFSCSPSHISHMFKKTTGKSFREYLTEIRLNAAKSLLINSHLSVTEIAYSVGFTDSNYFSNVFKNHVGISPREYRKTAALSS